MKNELRKRIKYLIIVIIVLFEVFLFFYSLILSSINYVNSGMTLETRFWYLIFAFDLLALALTTIITIIYKALKSPPSDETKETTNKYITCFLYFFAIGALFFLIMHFLVKYFLVALIPPENINIFLDLNPLFSLFVRYGQAISYTFFFLTAVILFIFCRDKGQANNNKSV